MMAAAHPVSAGTNGNAINGTPEGAAPPTVEPAEASSASPSATLDEIAIVAKRLQAVGAAIEPQIGASTYTMTSAARNAPHVDRSALSQRPCQQRRGMAEACDLSRSGEDREKRECRRG
jgi:hypothetical protein